MKLKKWLLAVAAGSCIMAGSAFAGEWKLEQGQWRYQDNGSYLGSGWHWIDGKCYYFDAKGCCLLNTVTPDGYTVDETGAWTVNGVVQTQYAGSNTQNIDSQAAWKGIYVASDGQTVVVTAADGNYVYLTYTGYSEEGWYSETEKLPYKNAEKTQVSSPYYYNGNLIEETIYTLTDTGIVVTVAPSGGWKEGNYIRQ